MRVTANNGTAFSTAFFARQSVYQKTGQAPSTGRHLILHPVTALASPKALNPARPLASLLAQLIAKAEDMPVSRERRRADPAEAARAYRAIASLGRPNQSKSLRLV
jgi:hypothetical protein